MAHGTRLSCDTKHIPKQLPWSCHSPQPTAHSQRQPGHSHSLFKGAKSLMTGDLCPRRAVGMDPVPEGFPIGVSVGKVVYERGGLWSERICAGQSSSAVFWYFLTYRWFFKINSTWWISVILVPVKQSCGGERWWKRDQCKVSVQKEKGENSRDCLRRRKSQRLPRRQCRQRGWTA